VQGRLISTYVNSPGNRYNKAVANLGLSCYLKMLLSDNFIHADLHPGAPAPPCTPVRRRLGPAHQGRQCARARGPAACRRAVAALRKRA